ncbi:hypothetical protein MANES_12G044000v8 [Manihot esculenta]|nr:hypothetical protein MANES_12G044000v8 [Manihot esculenta]
MELLWQDGQVVVQSQTQMSLKKSQHHKYDDAVLPVDRSTPREIPSSHEQHQHLFMQEDEMSSWLHYPLNDTNFDQDLCADLLYPSTTCVTSTTTTTSAVPTRSTLNLETRPQLAFSPTTAAATASRPPIPPTRRAEVVQNFAYFSRHRPRGGLSESGPSNLKTVLRESTVVDSSDTPAMGSESRISEAAVARSTTGVSSGENACGTRSVTAVAGTSSQAGGSNNKDTMTCEMTVTSSPGGSSASAEPPARKPATEDRKRKGIREEDTEYHSEDIEFESEAKRQARGSTSTKRSRAAEVHNLSERRRRDRINEKMRALQELIPRCNKSDKASMLDEAIEYLKSLQLQVQHGPNDVSWHPAVYGPIRYGDGNGDGDGDGHGHGRGNGHESAYDAISKCPGWCRHAYTGCCSSFGSKVPYACFSYAPCPSPTP